MEKLIALLLLLLLLFVPNNCFSSPFPINFLGRVSEKGEKKNHEVHSSFSYGTCSRFKKPLRE